MADLRELLIAVLAVAILFWLLRAVYAIHRRRKGQIRLSIDKTVSQEAKFEDPALSELPNGGARIVSMRKGEPAQSGSPAAAGAADSPSAAAPDPDASTPDGECEAEVRQRRQKPRSKQKRNWKQEILESKENSDKKRKESDLDSELGAISMTAGERIGFDSPMPRDGIASGRAGGRAADQSAQAPAREAEGAPPRSGEIPVRLAAAQEPAEPATREAAAKAPGAPQPEQVSRADHQPAPDARQAPSANQAESRTEAESEAISPDRIISLHVIAAEGREFAGRELWDFLRGAGLRYDRMKILSKTEGNQENSQPIFRAANIVNPGTFDADAIDDFSTPGVSMFMLLPAPINSLLAYEQMLATARRLAEALDGRLLNGDRREMTVQTIEQTRRRIREFDNRTSGSPSVSGGI